MAQKLKPASDSEYIDVLHAIAYLRAARDALKRSGSKRSVERVRKAIVSAEGALRHVDRRRMVRIA